MACGIPNISSWYTTAFEFFGGNQQDTFWKSYSNVFEPTNIRDAGFFSEVEGKLIPDKIKTVRGIGIPLDTVHDHYNGGKWAMANERCAALALKWVYDNPDDAKELGLRGAEHVKQNYAWDVVVPQWIKLIDEVKPNMAEMVEPKKEIDDTRINFIHA
jgi:glycosyltransferase involved in cell wall biosynthesis